MAGMFYSLKEAAEKLNITEEQVKELAREGKLREFRDGSSVLFKVDEVEALTSGTSGKPAKDTSASSKKPKRPRRTKKQEPEAEAQKEPIELEGPTEPMAAPAPEKPAQPVEPEKPAQPEPTAVEPETTPEPPTTEEEEISLALETGAPALQSDLTDADTALTGEGVSVLGETDKDYAVTDDTMAETTAAGGTADSIGTIGMAGTTGMSGSTPEAPLEELEEDVNLDSFGSGSGLLDLSLQADDTSLGGILDEIYTAEGGEEEKEPAAAGTAEQMTAEAEQIMPAEELAVPEPTAAMAPIIGPAYAEPAPDVQSQTLGMLLFLPLLVLLYTAVVAVAGLKGVMPSILSGIQGAIWYILIGAFVATGAVVGAAFLLTGGLGTGVKKPKTKKPKKPKKKGKEPAVPEDAAP